MSVYTDISEEQINTIGQAIGGQITDLTPIEAGISNSLYKATLNTEQKPEDIVIVIHETPDRITHGLKAKRAKNIPRLLEFAANNIKKIKSDYAKTRLPKPYKWNEERPDGMMRFPHAHKDKLVKKSIYVFPFIKGEELDWDISKCQSEDAIRNAGAGLAMFHSAVEGFDRAERMDNAYGFDQWMSSIDALLDNPDTTSRLDAFLALKDSGLKAEDVLNTLAKEADYIEQNWEGRTANLPQNIIHGDYYPDNMMITQKGKQYILDFGNCALDVEAYDLASAINAWTSEDGTFIENNVDAFLEGYNDIKPLSPDVEEQLPFLGRAAAFSRALLRIDIALNAQDPHHANSPEDCLVQLKQWQLKDEAKTGADPDFYARQEL